MENNWAKEQTRTCDNVTRLREKYGTRRIVTPTIGATAIVGALNQFQECVRYLNTRRSSGAVLDLDCEADVQDAVYLMLRPWVQDLVPENPSDRIASRFCIKDFVSRQAKTVIEVKYVRDADHGRGISREMHDDIETYRHHAYCDTIIFFVYDPDSLIPDQQRLREQIEEERFYKLAGRVLKCVLIVKP
jgi:REase_DpnII-MboI